MGILEEGGTIRRDMYKSFQNPEIPASDLPNITELNALLWSGANEFISQGQPADLVAHALLNFVTLSAPKVSDGLYAAGLIVTALKELQSGVYGR